MQERLAQTEADLRDSNDKVCACARACACTSVFWRLRGGKDES